ncbi:hypothetical protein EYF80_052837 [Liparis tanakae]|uniref:Uncharacterized protein n=1 Tax=Liparis tanakae TaxID=230148 RepID=A0A4Z2F788_9TELE|nr:hypothetical protein EYF80_052837 [Liparis tanakae]
MMSHVEVVVSTNGLTGLKPFTKTKTRVNSLESAGVGLLGEQLVVQASLQDRPLGEAEVLKHDSLRPAPLHSVRAVCVCVYIYIYIYIYMCVDKYRGGSGVLEAVVRTPQPQNVLCAVEELGEPVELTVAEIDGSLNKNKFKLNK